VADYTDARVLLDSISPLGYRLVTMVLKMPKVFLAEFNTHRVLNKSSASTRAIPLARQIEALQRGRVYIPKQWPKKTAGMEAREFITDEATIEKLTAARRRFLHAAIQQAQLEDSLGVHKQTAGRVLDGFSLVDTIVTGTDWSNFYHLREHKAAQPEMRELAAKMLEAHQKSPPVLRCDHLPFVTPDEYDYGMKVSEGYRQFDTLELMEISAARCARVSYSNHDGTDPQCEADLQLAARLKADGHMSPFEHCAFALDRDEMYEKPPTSLRGWEAYRFRMEPPVQDRTDLPWEWREPKKR